MPLVYAHEILSQCDMYFLNGSHFNKFFYVALLSTWLNLEHPYLTVMHRYWGYPQGRNYASIDNILKVMNFFKISHFALFGLFDIYAKDTKFINGTHTTHTEKYKYTQTHEHTDTDTIFTFYTF